jgi:hypothetical protein
VRAAIASLPWREQKVIGLYYYGEVTMKQIGAEIGVNESRVSQLHARAIRRLKDALGHMGAAEVTEMRSALVAFAAKKPVMAKAALPARSEEQLAPTPAVVLPYKRTPKPAMPAIRIRREAPVAIALAR